MDGPCMQLAEMATVEIVTEVLFLDLLNHKNIGGLVFMLS